MIPKTAVRRSEPATSAMGWLADIPEWCVCTLSPQVFEVPERYCYRLAIAKALAKRSIYQIRGRKLIVVDRFLLALPSPRGDPRSSP